jgi:hypothetical protein
VSPTTRVTDLLRNLQAARFAEAEALENLVAAIADPTTASLPAPPPDNSPTDAEPCYLSVRQLAARIPYAEQTIRNLMTTGELVEGVHFFKRRNRVMFWWPAMRAWVERQSPGEGDALPLVRNRNDGRP